MTRWGRFEERSDGASEMDPAKRKTQLSLLPSILNILITILHFGSCFAKGSC